jgi:hypothetical protein
VRKIILTLVDKRRTCNDLLVVKSVINSMEWKVGDCLKAKDVEEILHDRPMVTVKIVE